MWNVCSYNLDYSARMHFQAGFVFHVGTMLRVFELNVKNPAFGKKENSSNAKGFLERTRVIWIFHLSDSIVVMLSFIQNKSCLIQLPNKDTSAYCQYSCITKTIMQSSLTSTSPFCVNKINNFHISAIWMTMVLPTKTKIFWTNKCVRIFLLTCITNDNVLKQICVWHFLVVLFSLMMSNSHPEV